MTDSDEHPGDHGRKIETLRAAERLTVEFDDSDGHVLSVVSLSRAQRGISGAS